MNEETKNIETCLAENILSEVANVPTDPQFRSLTDEALDPLKQQALQQAGYDGYKEVVMYHQPYTFTSHVKQMKSNLILLLRRLWRYPFGRGTTASASDAAPIRSLADMWQHYITRLKGNPEYGIPSRLSQLTDLPDAPAILADRKISGVPEAEDGMSMARVICDASLDITELTDNNYGYTLNNSRIYCMQSALPKLKKVTLNGKGTLTDGAFNGNNVIEEIHLPEAEAIYRYDSRNAAIINCGNLKVVDMPKSTAAVGLSSNYPCIYNCAKLQKVVFGKVTEFVSVFSGTMPDIIHVEFAQGVNVSINFESNYGATWNPTNALDASRTDLIEEGSTAANNLQQFLSNFKTYIAERLTDNGKGLTLTLSQAVRDAIQQDPEIVSIITGKGWTISPAPTA